jgi:mannose-6-phosphate isomerase-like protein (cupin superfamily)
MYAKSDPRASLAPKAAAKARTGLIAEEQLATFYDTPPQIDDASGKSWFVRGNNFVVCYSDVAAGGSLTRSGQPDEYVVLLPKTGAMISWDGTTENVPGGSIAFVPAGESKVIVPEGGIVVRLFTIRSEDLVALCPNAAAYDIKRDHIPDFEAWPDPVGGFKIRHYSLNVPKEEGRFGRIFRCTTFMVNMLDAYDGPRDTTTMSPHHHDDFEQCSLLLEGAYTHHLRWPWTTDMADWKDDKTIEVSGPSAMVIPPPAIHTSRATGSGKNQLVDIFCPPREDFSAKPGWVLNSEDYPA